MFAFTQNANLEKENKPSTGRPFSRAGPTVLRVLRGEMLQCRRVCPALGYFELQTDPVVGPTSPQSCKPQYDLLYVSAIIRRSGIQLKRK